MKAVVYHQYGTPEVLEIAELPMPEPLADEVLIRVRASGVNPTDSVQRSGQFKLLMGKSFPKRIGCDVAGEIVSVGSTVTQFKSGDRVYGMTADFDRVGTAAEYVTMKAKWLAHTPGTLTDIQAAAVPLAAETALQALRDHGKLKLGDSVLVNGASGGVGLFAIQIAKAMGAHVTAVTSARNRELVCTYGADEVIDYATTDMRQLTQTFDLIADMRGGWTVGGIRHLLGKEGRFVTIAPNPVLLLKSFLSQRFGRKRIAAFFVESRASDLESFREWINTGMLRVHIDTVYSLDHIREAHAQIESKRTRGKLVLRIH
ncbi:MAG: NAD(P)-dependent alcohol dehydrogenase [Chloroflexota bacterium]|nr:NAD(P)-dependent alcohol dehydrogenase [Chloroflexota bacterium]